MVACNGATHVRCPLAAPIGCRNPTSDDYRSRAGPRLLSIRPTSAHGTADPFDRDRGGPQRLTYPALNRCSRTGLAPSATTASSAAPGGFGKHCHAARDAARAPAPTRLEVRNSLVRVQRNSLVRVHLYRSRRGRPGPNAAARAVGPLQIGASTSGRQPEGCLAVRHWPDTHRAPASRVLPTGITAHSFPGNVLGTPGSGARRGLRRNNVATRPGPTKRPAPRNRWPRCATCRPVLVLHQATLGR
jgi:hypothetical protein